jgi:fatty-acid desaturase
MVRPLRQRIVLVLLLAMIVAVLALAVAQSTHLQPLLPALIVAFAVAFLVPIALHRLVPCSALPARRLARNVLPTHFQLPPPVTPAA